ncbi:MAG: type VI secretion system accessory protein TagJ [Rhodospirillales bacterium]|nr:type VI secretion system accessory protein TagJ [Rhodospirillales bacterium]
MSEVSTSAGSLFRQARLDDAVAAAAAAVRAQPADLAARVLLAEFLLFAGNLERADVILDAASGVDPGAATVLAEFRQLLRAEMARRQLYRDGRLPEFLGEPTPTQRASLAALVALRAGDVAEAAREAAAAEAGRPRTPGRSGKGRFDDFRDADDLLAGSFEVLTTTGKYFWVPTERVASLVFHAPKRARDLYLRRASMDVRDGPDGEVYLPALYPAEGTDPSIEQRLGRASDWRELAPGLVRGIGQRTFLVGEDAVGMMELKELAFGDAAIG